MMTAPLELKRFIQNPSTGHKVLVVVLDGVGATSLENSITAALDAEAGVLPETPFRQGNAVCAAYMPRLHALTKSRFFRTLLAHGPSVGLPSKDDMGNSEVGHNALGAGRIFAQGAKLVGQALASGALFEGSGWKKTVCRAALTSEAPQPGQQATLHFCGLLSDGNVHSHIDHLLALITRSKTEGVRRVRLHMLLDGRDVSPTSALEYVERLERVLSDLRSPSFDVAVASGGGRSMVTMDRYESDWRIVERGYAAHVRGEARAFSSLHEAVTTLRNETKLGDQDLPPFIVADGTGKPLGIVEDGDSFVFFNFRGDRAIEITRALTEETFEPFDRKRFPKVHFAGMMQYDGDLKLPSTYLVEPPSIAGVMGEYLAHAKVTQFACSETQKFGHVTYFWNGNRSGKFDETTETYIEVPSDRVPFQQRPWMKSAEIADATIEAMRSDSFRVGRINFANGDMVGHTGDFAATVVAMAAVDVALGRILDAAKETNTIVLVTADHGNADEMYELDKKTGRPALDASGVPKVKTSHTLSKVPCALFNLEALPARHRPHGLRSDLPQAGLANVAATVLELAGFHPPAAYEPSLLDWQTGHPTGDDDSKKKVSASQPSSDESFAVAKAAVAFHRTIAHLRSPEGGCPWDLEQTFGSLRSYLIEEAYEAVHAAEGLVAARTSEERADAAAAFADELGDVLLQVFLNAQVAADERLFHVRDVFHAIDEKMIRRHPHVFGGERVSTAEAVVTQWDAIKSTEKQENPTTTHRSLLHKASKKKALPTLEWLRAVSRRSYKLGFAWQTWPETFADLRSEVAELEVELTSSQSSRARIADEVGDVAFALANVVTWLNENRFEEAEAIDLDIAAREAGEKFVTRFAEMEAIRREQNAPLDEASAKALSLDAWNTLWKDAKKRRYR
ncbi:MAG: 2,3-bisphosphoglycerate-independent phosphoglycerate mutase [Silvanigrellales bacterium]|nr:2,3-bisphosphoglycerate-independent phosphoglycerate mutase [Silvanigrellales bacterium]